MPSRAQQQLARDVEVERAAMGQRLSASKFRRGAASQSAATSMAGFLVNCRSAAVQLQKKQTQRLRLDPYQCQRATRSVWSAHARASVYTLLLRAPGLVSCVRQHASCQPCMQLFGSCLGFAVLKRDLSAGRVRVHTCCECYNKRGYIRTWYVYSSSV